MLVVCMWVWVSVVTVSESATTIDTLSADSITFTCTITGITRNVTVEWDGVDQLSSDIVGLTATTGEFTVDQGSYSDNTQTSTLVVSGVGLENLTSGYFGVDCSISENPSYTDSSSNITLYVSSEYNLTPSCFKKVVIGHRIQEQDDTPPSYPTFALNVTKTFDIWTSLVKSKTSFSKYQL